ncbi:MAG: DUF72 domain-containing protein [Pseudomonas sp.]|uniref:DUF72 domain-containing protein n=1 Tax=Pseudomonas sp. TaxID=306 RepID=UPI0033947192
MPVHVGTAGWSLPRSQWSGFPLEGTHLQRYAAVLPAVEINSSFYRPHQPGVYAKWAASVPETFRFSVKMPQALSHQQRLCNSEALLDGFLSQVAGLGSKLGCLLLQLPPSLGFEPRVVATFLQALRDRHAGAVALEARHSSWFVPEVEALLQDYRLARVAADPPRALGDGQPGGWPGRVYYRLHGSPKIYQSSYSAAYLEQLSLRLRPMATAGREVWCIFDNTVYGAALANARTLCALLKALAASAPETASGSSATTGRSPVR